MLLNFDARESLGLSWQVEFESWLRGSRIYPLKLNDYFSEREDKFAFIRKYKNALDVPCLSLRTVNLKLPFLKQLGWGSGISNNRFTQTSLSAGVIFALLYGSHGCVWSWKWKPFIISAPRFPFLPATPRLTQNSNVALGVYGKGVCYPYICSLR